MHNCRSSGRTSTSSTARPIAILSENLYIMVIDDNLEFTGYQEPLEILGHKESMRHKESREKRRGEIKGESGI